MLAEESKKSNKSQQAWLDSFARKPVQNSQFIFPLQDKHAHSASIVQMPDQTFLACWFYGTGEKWADDVVIQAATGTIEAQGLRVEWNKPFVIADTPNFPDLNPVMFVDQRKELWLLWSTMIANESEYALLKYKKSPQINNLINNSGEHNQLHIYIPNFANDFVFGIFMLAKHLPLFGPKLVAEINYKNLEGTVMLICGLIILGLALLVVWSKWSNWKFPVLKIVLYTALTGLLLGGGAVYMIHESLDDRYLYRMGWMARSQPLLLDNGTIILPLYSDAFSSSLMAITEDYGKTWEFSEPILGYGNIQPSLVQKDDGTIVAFMRDNGYYGKIRKSHSQDKGRTWSEVESMSLPNPGSSVAIEELASGNWLMVYNDLFKGRHRLKVSLSSDEGKTWTHHKYLEMGEKYEHSFSYPTVYQASDGMIHCVYSYRLSNQKVSIKHNYFSEAWVLSESEKLTSR